MSYSVIKADLKSNKGDIFAVWEKNYPGVLEKKYSWIYENNPAGAAHVWLLWHEGSKEYVGVTALFPRRFKINGKTLLGGIAGDLVVNKEHRSMGPALMLHKKVLSVVQDGLVDFIYGFPNRSSEPVVKRLGYKLLGKQMRLIKILQTEPRLSRMPFGKYWCILVGPFLNSILRLLSFETWHYFKKGDCFCEAVKDFDKRFDLFWEKAQSKFTIAGERTALYLKWKFLMTPHFENKIIGLFNFEKNTLKGYIVYRHLDRGIEIRDFLTDGEAKSLPTLMAAFLSYARSTGAESVVIAMLENGEVLKQMQRFGFIQRNNEQSVALSISDSLIIKFPFIKENKHWLMLQSDDDM